MKSKSFSPITIIEQLLFERLGNTRIRVWHYLLSLFALFIIPMLVPSSILSSSIFFTIFCALIITMWLSSRLIGRQLSKTSSVDSVLIYRFFAAASWIIPMLVGAFSLLIGYGASATERQTLVYITCFTTAISAAHIVGIVLHLRSRHNHIHNVKKEDLFQ